MQMYEIFVNMQQTVVINSQKNKKDIHIRMSFSKHNCFPIIKAQLPEVAIVLEVLWVIMKSKHNNVGGIYQFPFTYSPG